MCRPDNVGMDGFLETKSYSLHSSPLSTGTGRGQAESTNTATSPDTRGEDILLIKLASLQLGGLQVCGVDSCLGVAAVTFIYHRVKEVSKHLHQ